MKFIVPYLKYVVKFLVSVFVFISMFIGSAYSQIDTEFWFVVPELSHRGSTGGTPGTLRLATMELEATVTIEMPANIGFVPITVDIPANSDAAVDLTHLIDLPAFPNRDLLENKALSASGINNYGLRITATSLISAYWEVNFSGGADLWVLKGSNGLGTLFYTPFQKEAPNNTTFTPRPYSAIDIVATKAATQVTVTLPPGLSASFGQPFTTFAGSRVFNLGRGQTLSIFPEAYDATVAKRLAGTKIEATDSIAVVIKDDAVTASSEADVVGDQLVPITVIGSQYIVPSLGNYNRVYVVATEPNTRIEVTDAGGVLQTSVNLTVAGEQGTLTIPSAAGYFRIYSTNSAKFYAFHVAPDNKGRGGAILPSVGSCTGNTQVAFTRARNDNRFYFYILVEDGNQDKFLVDGVVNNGLIDPTKFVPVANTNGWLAYRSNILNVAALAVGQHRVTNTGGVFHFGIINGFPSGQLYYGYYSDYGNLNAGAFAGGDQAASTIIRSCFGSPVNLYAYGGTSYTWTGPIEYLDNPNIQNPVASNLPPGAYNFTVTIHSDCGIEIVDITVLVSSKITAFFNSNISSGCSPLSDILFTDRSINAYEWQYYMGDGTPVIRYDNNTLTPYVPPPDPFEIIRTYENFTDEPLEYTVTLLAKNEDGCSDIYTKVITVNPSITASFQQSLPVDACDNPYSVSFTNESFGNEVPAACAVFTDPNDSTYFVWNFGDGEGYVSTDCNETYIHTYLNTNDVPETYDVSLIAISPFGCRDTVYNTVTVTSAFNPDFELNKTNGCADPVAGGLEVTLRNMSTGDITIGNWTITPAVAGFVGPAKGASEVVIFPNNTNNELVYTIRYDVENVDGCQKTLSKDVTVYPLVVPDFTMPASACNETEITFTDNTFPVTVPASTYSWDFGDGSGSSLQSPLHTYYNTATSPAGNYIPTIYDVKLKVTNPWGCRDSITHQIEIASLIEADFTVLPAAGCSPLEVVFNNNSLGNAGDTHLWDFGNASNSGLPNPGNVIYTNNGIAPVTYTVRYTRTNTEGCTDFVERDIIVYPRVNINSILPATGTTVCDSTEVDLAVGIDQALPNMTYSWSFGDGAAGLGATPTHLYRNFTDLEVPYTATVVARSEFGCIDVESTVINVSPRIVALFSANKYEVCSGEIITFDYLQMGSITNYSFLYEFDDGSPDVVFAPDPSGTFTEVFTNTNPAVLTVTVTLTVSNGNGACNKVYVRTIKVNPNVTATFDAYIGGVLLAPGDPFCSPELVYFESSTLNADNFHWQFGDLGASFEENPTFEFINIGNTTIFVDVTLTASSILGCNAAITKTYAIEPEVKAIYDLNNAAGCVPFNVEVSALDDPTVTYAWYLDGVFRSNNRVESLSILENKTGENIEIAITLTATRGLCTKTNDSQVVIAYPEADAKWSGTAFAPAQCSPATIQLVNETDLYDPTKPVTNVLWQIFDPSNTLIQSSIQQNFDPAPITNFSNTLQKDYAVRLTATTNDGCEYTYEEILTVNPNPKAQFNVNFIESCTPMTIEVTNESITILDPDDYTWDWDGGAATSLGLQNYEVVYQNLTETVDNKWIQLSLLNQYGCLDTYDYLFTVLPEIRPALSIAAGSVDKICGGETITFNNNSLGGPLSYYWDFGDGSTRVTTGKESVTHTYVNNTSSPQHLTVTLRVENGIDCDEQATIPVIIYPRVVAAQSYDITGVCNGVTIDLTNSSTNAAIAGSTFTWNFTTTDPGGSDLTVISSGDALTGVNLVNGHQTNPVTYNVDFSSSTTWYPGTADEHTCPDATIGNSITVYPLLTPIYDAPAAACSGLNGVELTFAKNAASSGGPVGGVTLQWDFKDGDTQTSTFTNVPHTFLNIGSTPFTLPTTVFATQVATGCTTSIDIPVTVYPRIIAAQSYSIIDVCNGVTIDLTNASTNSTIAGSSFTWDFTTTNPGGSNLTVTSPSDALTGVNLVNSDLVNPVTYNLNFTASTLWNSGTAVERTCTHNVAGNDVVVYPLLTPIYDPPPAACSGLNGVEITFVKNANSSGGPANGVTLQWDFADGNTRTTDFVNVSHTYENLAAEDFVGPTTVFATQKTTGCTTSFDVDVRVHPKVQSLFTFEFGDVCEYPLPVNFSNSSLYHTLGAGVTTTFHWDYGYQWGGVDQEDTRSTNTPHTYYFFNNEANATSTYTVSLTPQQLHGISGLTCTDTYTKTIKVYPELIADFNLPIDFGCNPLTVSFVDLSSGVLTAEGGSYLWDLGDSSGTISTLPLDKVYSHTDKTQSINYPISLTITNPLGCKKFTSGIVEVYPLVESKFIVDRTQGCTPLYVPITNLSTSTAYSYQWAFNGGTTPSSTNSQPGTIEFINALAPPDVLEVQNPVIHLETYLNPALYDLACTETDQIEVTVFPHVYPSFDAVLEGCHPLIVDFDNTTSVFGTTNNGTYLWEFGTGTTSNNIDHTLKYLNPSFTENRIFPGKLTALSEHGCTDSIDFEVEVWPKPKSRMEILTDYMACSPFEVEIENLSRGKNSGSTLRFDYDFGDGNDTTTVNTANMFHVFRNKESEIVPYMITLLVETEDGCLDTSYQTIHVYPEVTAIFDFDPGNAACNPFVVTMDNSSLNSWYYRWDFDNGLNSHLESPTHRFVNNSTEDRIFNVALTAYSEYDCVDRDTLPLTVYAAPVADFAINPPLKVYPDAEFVFVNQSNPASPNWYYTWTYGDGYGSPDMHPDPHTYEKWGPPEDDFQYLVTLLIENDHCSDSVSHYLTLRPAEPIAFYDAEDYVACSPLIVYFVNRSTYGDSYFWDFGDGATSTEFEPIHTYEEPGYYNVGLTVWGDGGVKQYFNVFQVFPNPVARFAIAPQKVMLPDAKVHMYSLSEGAVSYLWDFGDGDISTSRDPVHTYIELGEYRVALTVWSIDGCTDSISEYPAVWVEGAGTIRFPNAFMPSKLGPNGGYYDEVDYKNEVFHPIADGVLNYRLMIFNRWGEQIFQSDDIKIGWDGYYKGKLSSQDVYVWRAIGTFTNGKPFDLRGNVTLLR